MTVQDISCVGQCSLTVAQPILSACGIETCVLPSAVLSTHTAFPSFFCRDLTDEMPRMAEEWKRQGIRFDAVYTGYLGSARQIGFVRDIMRDCIRPGGLKIVDPAMADNGRLYPAFDGEFVGVMRSLCAEADLILPNLTEACLLAGAEYREAYDEDDVAGLLDRLTAAVGDRTVVLTGVSYRPDRTGVLVRQGGTCTYYAHRRISRGCHGTGDVFASAFTGALMRGRSVVDSARLAADFTVACIENTVGDEKHWYGVKFETMLPRLIAAFGEEKETGI